MRTKICFAFMIGAVAAFSVPAFAEVTVKDAWVRATPGNAKVSAAYAIMTNTGSFDDVLIGVRTPSAGVAHLHASEGKDGIMRMNSVEQLPVPAKRDVALAPGSYHIMIMELRAPLKVGDKLPLVFSFKNQGDVTVSAKVMPLNYAGPKESAEGEHHHH